MLSNHSESTSIGRRIRAAGAAVSLALLGGLLMAPQAVAASSPTSAELLDACSWADVCTFHPQSYTTYIGPEHQVGSLAYNCGTLTNDHAVSWSDTTSETNSVSISVKVGMKFAEAFEAAVEGTYGHDWTVSHTDTETNTLHIPAKNVGWITRGTSKQKASGWYEIHFPSKYYDHYYWYVYDFVQAGFNVDQPNAGYVSFQNRAMTTAERQARNC